MENTEENTKKETESSYQQYLAMGGIINEKDYQSALDRAKSAVALDNKSLILQVESIARKAGIALHNSESTPDPRVVLYGILRMDANPGMQYHHNQMGDQKLFAEALRMSGDKESLKKLIEAYPNIFDERA